MLKSTQKNSANEGAYADQDAGLTGKAVNKETASNRWIGLES
jgi:hypothetical protein